MGLLRLGQGLWITRWSEDQADGHRFHPRRNVEGQGGEGCRVGLARLDKPEAVGIRLSQADLDRRFQNPALSGFDLHVQVHEVIQKEDFLTGRIGHRVLHLEGGEGRIGALVDGFDRGHLDRDSSRTRLTMILREGQTA